MLARIQATGGVRFATN